MQISSPAFPLGGPIPVEYTCDGENISPPLLLADVPTTAQSLVLIVDDPEAPQGIFTHWLVWNISPEMEEIGEGESPEGAKVGRNDGGSRGYTGPCPPSGTHHYFFKIFALDTQLDNLKGDSRDDVEEVMEGHVIDQAEMYGLYSREEEEFNGDEGFGSEL